MYPHPPHYHLLWEWNNFQHTQAYIIFTYRILSLANAKFTYYPATKLFNNIPPNINKLNHDILEFQKGLLRSILVCTGTRLH
jgi:hypothetical protein